MKTKLNDIKRINRDVLVLNEQHELLQKQYAVLDTKKENFENVIKIIEEGNDEMCFSVTYERLIVNRYDHYQRELKKIKKKWLTSAIAGIIVTTFSLPVFVLLYGLAVLPVYIFGCVSLFTAVALIPTRYIRKELKNLKKYDIEDFRKKVVEVDIKLEKNKLLIEKLINKKATLCEKLVSKKNEIEELVNKIEELKSHKSEICINLVEETFIQNGEQQVKTRGRTYKLK